MKAILLRHLAATDNLPTRMRVTCVGLAPRTYFTQSRIWDLKPCEPVAELAIKQFILDHELQWSEPQFGTIPCGSLVATFRGKNNA